MFSKEMTITKEVWWLMLLTGIISVLFGFVALFWPKLTLGVLVYMYAIFVVIAGAVTLFQSLASIKKDPLWWLMLLFALFNLGIGVFLFRNPQVTAAIFVILLSVFVFVQSIIDLVVASYTKKGDGRWLWIVTGIFGLIAGFVILFYPLAATVAFVWVLGIYALVHGIVAVAYAFQTRKELKKLPA